MNLFQSEEHARQWTGFDPSYEEGLQPLSYWVEWFSAPRFSERGSPKYISRRDAGEF